jgi:hypothetical protein
MNTLDSREGIGMNIVDSCPEHISVRALAARAGCTAKTVRRAISMGALPRRYAASVHGPALVFLPAEAERWLAARTTHPGRGRRAVRPPGLPDAHTAHARQAHAVAGKLARLEAKQRAVAAVFVMLETAQAEQYQAIATLSVAFDALAEHVRALAERPSLLASLRACGVRKP